ncbi:hypothetical protein CBOM_05709 [Ceraceosorus bombacis]|uniref:Uncharacterized protein n=1 Tax=Ceraceosorus bombacis TaxID=401625 RepID=A0A0P1BRU7_9BASI|nr:hypothetical protein CBOM_05709 [Ceraceosorus bombacis]
MSSTSARLARPKEIRVWLDPVQMGTLLEGLRPLKQRHPRFLSRLFGRITSEATILRDAGIEGELTKALDWSADRQKWLCEELFFHLNPGLSPPDVKAQVALAHFKALIHLKAAYDVLFEEKLFGVLERGSGAQGSHIEDELDRVVGQLLASFQAGRGAQTPSALSTEPRYLKVTKGLVLWEPPRSGGRQPAEPSQGVDSSTREAAREAVAGAVRDEGHQAAGAAPSRLRHWMEETVNQNFRADEGPIKSSGKLQS